MTDSAGKKRPCLLKYMFPMEVWGTIKPMTSGFARHAGLALCFRLVGEWGGMDSARFRCIHMFEALTSLTCLYILGKFSVG